MTYFAQLMQVYIVSRLFTPYTVTNCRLSSSLSSDEVVDTTSGRSLISLHDLIDGMSCLFPGTFGYQVDSDGKIYPAAVIVCLFPIAQD